jgi:hypothetical protein
MKPRVGGIRPSDEDSSMKYIVLGAAVVAAGVGIYAIYKLTGDRKSPSPSSRPERSSAPPALAPRRATEKIPPKQTIINVLETMQDKTKQIIAKLKRREQELKKRSPKINDDERAAELTKLYQAEVTKAKAEAFALHSVTESGCNAGVAKFHVEEDVSQALGALDTLEQQVSAMGVHIDDLDPEEQKALDALPPELTADRVFEIWETLAKRMNATMQQCYREVKQSGIPEHSPQFDSSAREKYISKVDSVKDSVFTQFGVDEQTLDLAVRKYSHDSEFVQRVQGAMYRQQQEAAGAR